jgi:hypothetical protein
MGNRKRAKLIQKTKDQVKRPRNSEKEKSSDESTSCIEEEDRAIFLTMKKAGSVEGDRGLHFVSYAALGKIFDLAAPGGLLTVKKKKNGTIEIQAKNRKAADATLRIKRFFDTEVEITEDNQESKKFNRSKGVAYHPEFRCMMQMRKER